MMKNKRTNTRKMKTPLWKKLPIIGVIRDISNYRSWMKIIREEAEDPHPSTISRTLGPPGTGSYHEGPQVSLLQRWLQQLGHHKVSETGRYDRATLNGVQAFQMKHKLTLSGKVDAKTAARLTQQIEQLSAVTRPSDDLSASVPEPEGIVDDLGQPGSKATRSQGQQVWRLQEALQQLGFQVTINGQFDRATFTAVRQLQSQQQLPITGLVEAQTRTLLNRLLLRQQQLSERQQVLLNLLDDFLTAQELAPLNADQHLALSTYSQRLAAQSSADLSALEAPTALPVTQIAHRLGTKGEMGIISQGEEVEWLQGLLASHDYDVKVTGTFDLQTYTALRQFQADHGLPVSGESDDATRAQLNALLHAQYTRANLLHQLEQVLTPLTDNPAQAAGHLLALSQGASLENLWAETLAIDTLPADLGPANRPGRTHQGPAVELLQIRLRQRGATLAISGNYDDATYAAVRQLQQRHKLPMTGLMDERTAELLNTKECDRL
jgi:peptidoglycan hydrolase-like protein with peptidoglycan-binding domain